VTLCSSASAVKPTTLAASSGGRETTRATATTASAT
jgi:hypothetical protein